MTNKYSDKAIRSKKLGEMNPAEQALLEMEIQKAVESIKSRYKGEANTLIGIAAALRDEGGRILYGDKPKQQERERQSSKQNEDDTLSLFDEGNR